MSSDNDTRNYKNRRRSAASVDFLLREAKQFIKNGQEGMEGIAETVAATSAPPAEEPDQSSVRRSSRRITRACVSNKNCATVSTPLKSTYHSHHISDDGSASNNSFNLCDDSIILPSSPGDMFGADDGVLQMEMESLQIRSRPFRMATRKQNTKTSHSCETLCVYDSAAQETMSNCIMESASASGSSVSEDSSPPSSKPVEEMTDCDGGRLEEMIDAELAAIYTNQAFVKPENAGLETIEEADEFTCEESPVKSKKSKKEPRTKKKLAKPWRLIPHLAVNPPEIWWQELPVQKQAECRKKARLAGYRPPTKKRQSEAEKRVENILARLDQELLTDETQSYDGETPELSEVSLESTFNSVQVFVGDSSCSSLSSSSLK